MHVLYVWVAKLAIYINFLCNFFHKKILIRSLVAKNRKLHIWVWTETWCEIYCKFVCSIVWLIEIRRQFNLSRTMEVQYYQEMVSQPKGGNHWLTKWPITAEFNIGLDNISSRTLYNEINLYLVSSYASYLLTARKDFFLQFALLSIFA